MNIHIITDSSCDIPQDLINKHNIKVIPLNIYFGEEQFKAGVDIDTPTFYEKMRHSTELPKSAAPAPHDFLEVYKEIPAEEAIIVITLSNALSSTYDNARIAKDMLLEDQPNRKVEVITALTSSMGLGLIVLEAVSLRAEQSDYQEIVKTLQESVIRMKTIFTLDTLENVIKGGRLNRVKGTIANVLNIKLLLETNNQGEIEVREKVRGSKKAIQTLIDSVGEHVKHFDDKILAITHSNCEEKAGQVLEMIKTRYSFKDYILTEMGPLIGTYAGEGGVVIAFKED